MHEAVQLSLAEFTLCPSLTVLWVLVASHWLSLCVRLVLYGHLIGCHWHWLTLRASSELVILSICPPTARVINIWVTVQNAAPGVTAAPFARQSPSTPAAVREASVMCKCDGKMQRNQHAFKSVLLLWQLWESIKIKLNNFTVRPSDFWGFALSAADKHRCGICDVARRPQWRLFEARSVNLCSTPFCQLLQAETQNLACVELN